MYSSSSPTHTRSSFTENAKNRPRISAPPHQSSQSVTFRNNHTTDLKAYWGAGSSSLGSPSLTRFSFDLVCCPLDVDDKSGEKTLGIADPLPILLHFLQYLARPSTPPLLRSLVAACVLAVASPSHPPPPLYSVGRLSRIYYYYT